MSEDEDKPRKNKLKKEKLKISIPTLQLRYIIFLAFIVRVAIIPFFNDDFNLWATVVFTKLLMEGCNPWIIVFRDPTLHWINPWRCPSLQLFPTAPAYIVYTYTENTILLIYLTKLPQIFADMVTIFFLYKILWKINDNGKVTKLLMLYAFNPITIFTSAFSITTDPISVMFSVIALFFFISAVSTIGIATSAIFLGWAIASKLYPIFILPVFVIKLKNLKERVIFVFFASLPLVILSMPFLIWNFESYISMLLIHNLGGAHPLLPYLNPQISIISKILFFILTITFFLIAYFKRTSITANIVLSFFALYFAMGILFPANYFSWIIPFAVLLLADRNAPRFKGSSLLPFISIPSIVWYFIFNGPYNTVEGATGIFYWTYHWLRQKVVIFRAFPFLQLLQPAIFFVNLVMIIYFLLRITKSSHAYGIQTKFSFSLQMFCALRKNKKLVFSSFIILMLSLTIFPCMVPCELVKPNLEVAPSTLTFFDDFSSSILNYQWGCVGKGTYILNFDKNPSCITLNGTVCIYRGWGNIMQGFANSSLAYVKLRFKFNSLFHNAQGVIIAKADGGWFGVISNNSLTNFVYFNDNTQSYKILAPIDHAWHEYRMDYNTSGRFIYFDDKFVSKYEVSKFSFLFLGNPPEAAQEFMGSSSIDWVKVTIEDFPTDQIGKEYVLYAFIVPLIILTFITATLLYLKANHLRKETSKFGVIVWWRERF